MAGSLGPVKQKNKEVTADFCTATEVPRDRFSVLSH
jgi:hypothetical protein